MVEVQVCVEKMLHLQVVAGNVFLDVSPLIFVGTATIDDDGFLGVVAHHIAVLA